ncbi:MAG: hypothetical protein IKO49_06370 [Bacilli bacterium]|nr:hypothetical protein [Bacilli bacterium]
MASKKNKKKKEKHIVGRKELIFDVVSVVSIIMLGIYIGYRSITYYTKETMSKKKEANTLAAAIRSNNEITKGNTGLRKSEDGYYFIGNVENNYLKAFNRLYRIIEVTNDNKIKIVSDFNEAAMIYGNTNDYQKSNINIWLNKGENDFSGVYYQTIPGVENLLSKTSYCEGVLKNDKVKCPKKKYSSYFSLLTIEDYIRALGKKSYLNNGKYSFILGFDEDSNPLYITEDGVVSSASSYDGYGIRVVMTLKKNALILGGVGTKDDPYILNQEGNENNINKYVRLGDDLFQIIEEQGNYLRLRQNDYLSLNNIYPEIAFNNKGAEFSLKNRYNIGYYLNYTYYNKLPYRSYLSDCSFNVGEISTATSYSYGEIYKEKIVAKVGLINMFDLNTNNVQTDYYLINKTSSVGSMVRTYNSLGIVDDDKATEKKKIVPVICLDKTLFKNGNGNIDNPYVVE